VEPLPAEVPADLYSAELQSEWEREALQQLQQVGGEGTGDPVCVCCVLCVCVLCVVCVCCVCVCVCVYVCNDACAVHYHA
jgi:hypothetical protein